jgi:hypothetical protein
MRGDFFNIAHKLLSEKEFYEQTVHNCEKVFAEQQGALAFVVNALKQDK